MSDDETMTIEQELCDALNTKQKKSEHRQDYLQRLVKGCKKLTDDEWNRLREIPTQEWVNGNLTRLSDGRDKDKKDDEIDLEDFPDRAAEDDEKMSTTHTDTDDEKPRKKSAAKPEKSVKKAKKAKKADEANKEEESDKEQAGIRIGTPKRKSTPEEAKPNKSEKFIERKITHSRGSGTYVMIRELMISDPTMPATVLIENLAKKNLNPSKFAVNTVRQHCLAVMRALLSLPMDEIKKLKKVMEL
jgi:hypothetical protein